jgi:hypothetical protein
MRENGYFEVMGRKRWGTHEAVELVEHRDGVMAACGCWWVVFGGLRVWNLDETSSSYEDRY